MKYVIEIEDVPFGRNDDPVIPHGMDELYRAKGFKSLVFDQNGLDKLTPYTEPDRKAIEDEVWQFAKDIRLESFIEAGCLYGYISEFDTYQEAKAKHDAQKNKKDSKVELYDEVLNDDGNKGIVVGEDDDYYNVLWWNGSCGIHYKNSDDFKKTGRNHPQVAELLKALKGE